MKIMIVRHGEPNYEIDGLTEKGRLEAELLSHRLVKETITGLYCSPLGRARLTAEPTEKKLGINAEILPWLREFDVAEIKLPYLEKADICWDIMPEFIDSLENIYHPTRWLKEDFIKNSHAPAYYKEVCGNFDALLARHGYERDGYNYKATRPNHDTLVFVCHFGLGSVLLSHLLNCSPYSLWQHTCMAPTSVTTVYTEERKAGIAQFRASAIGDVSHLYAAGEEPSFSARFCECFTDDTRH
ncbi:MAG: histidine phosphatase family protein [Ruminococcaceae bacterium]|nr:histidine phosphatase family protein [Oscillospiraceae bacterium]